jgi:uncharacterized protein (DUF58 family)
MARQALAATPPVAEPELKAFARVAGKLLLAQAPRGAGAQALRRRRGAGLTPVDHRDYLPGDDLRWVDWRQSAKLGRPIVRRFQVETSADWLLCVDASASMRAGHLWPRAVEITTALAFVLLDGGHRVALRLFAQRLTALCPFGRGPAHFARMSRLLATHVPPRRGAASTLGACRVGLSGRPSLFVVSDFLADGDQAEDLGRLAHVCGQAHALQLRSERQRALPERGPLALVDVETGARIAVQSGASLARSATAAADALTARLRHFCATREIVFSAADLGTAWQRTLLTHLRQKPE